MSQKKDLIGLLKDLQKKHSGESSIIGKFVYSVEWVDNVNDKEEIKLTIVIYSKIYGSLFLFIQECRHVYSYIYDILFILFQDTDSVIGVKMWKIVVKSNYNVHTCDENDININKVGSNNIYNKKSNNFFSTTDIIKNQISIKNINSRDNNSIDVGIFKASICDNSITINSSNIDVMNYLYSYYRGFYKDNLIELINIICHGETFCEVCGKHNENIDISILKNEDYYSIDVLNCENPPPFTNDDSITNNENIYDDKNCTYSKFYKIINNKYCVLINNLYCLEIYCHLRSKGKMSNFKLYCINNSKQMFLEFDYNFKDIIYMNSDLHKIMTRSGKYNTHEFIQEYNKLIMRCGLKFQLWEKILNKTKPKTSRQYIKYKTEKIDAPYIRKFQTYVTSSIDDLEKIKEIIRHGNLSRGVRNQLRENKFIPALECDVIYCDNGGNVLLNIKPINFEEEQFSEYPIDIFVDSLNMTGVNISSSGILKSYIENMSKKYIDNYTNIFVNNSRLQPEYFNEPISHTGYTIIINNNGKIFTDNGDYNIMGNASIISISENYYNISRNVSVSYLQLIKSSQEQVMRYLLNEKSYLIDCPKCGNNNIIIYKHKYNTRSYCSSCGKELISMILDKNTKNISIYKNNISIN